MNYNEIARMATAGINFFSDANGMFKFFFFKQKAAYEIA